MARGWSPFGSNPLVSRKGDDMAKVHYRPARSYTQAGSTRSTIEQPAPKTMASSKRPGGTSSSDGWSGRITTANGRGRGEPGSPQALVSNGRGEPSSPRA